MMSDYCREQLQSCEDYLIKYCKEKLQAEKEGRSLDYVSMHIARDSNR